jgi:hypothetical protein
MAASRPANTWPEVTSMKWLIFALPLLCLGTASASTIEDFESGDSNWAQNQWFDPGYSVSASWSVAPYDAVHGNVYVGTNFGSALAYRTDVWGEDLGIKASMRMTAISHGGAHAAVAVRYDPLAGTGYHFSIRTDEVSPGQYSLNYVLVSLDGWPNANHVLGVVPSGLMVVNGAETPWIDLELRAIGNSIECYADGSPVFSILDSAWTAGTAGVLSATHCNWGSACHVTYADDIEIVDAAPVASDPSTWSRVKALLAR